jgi:hypothetical protein
MNQGEIGNAMVLDVGEGKTEAVEAVEERICGDSGILN